MSSSVGVWLLSKGNPPQTSPKEKAVSVCRGEGMLIRNIYFVHRWYLALKSILGLTETFCDEPLVIFSLLLLIKQQYLSYFDKISVFPFPICHSVNKLKGEVHFKVYVYKYVFIYNVCQGLYTTVCVYMYIYAYVY